VSRFAAHPARYAFLGLLILSFVGDWTFPSERLTAQATSRSAQEIARALEGNYAAARTLQATFLERYRQGRNVRVESGTAYFSRPGRMRWEYESPEEKLFLVDGTNAWFYVPADRTATRAKVKESTYWHTPLALLAGKTRRGALNRLCGRMELLPGSGTGHGLKCFPKDKVAPFREILLETDAEFRVMRIVIHEPGDVETEFRFAGWQANVPLAEALFHFSVPRGVAIVDEDSIAPAGP
jgi:outer membrane lipoprotein carrier protein